MREWPLSSEELEALRGSLAQKLSMYKAFNTFSRYIEEVGSSLFTHKCICPNPDHKQGNERTPSCYFSEQDRSFICWGCHWRGDIFDFLEVMLERPAEHLIKFYAKQENLSLDDCLDKATAKPQFNIEDLNCKLGIELRDHLISFEGHERYEEEKEWVDQAFKRMDDRFEKIDSRDVAKAQQFIAQIEIELQRRQLM